MLSGYWMNSEDAVAGDGLPELSGSAPGSSLDAKRPLRSAKKPFLKMSQSLELQKAGVDVSRPTVQRALAKKGVYAK